MLMPYSDTFIGITIDFYFDLLYNSTHLENLLAFSLFMFYKILMRKGEDVMRQFDYFDFHIENYTPETLPFNRLMEYLFQLKKLFKDCDVHFLTVKDGSAAPAFQVAHEDSTKIENIISSFEESDLCNDFLVLLKKDNTTAYFTKNNRIIYRFKGVNDNLNQEEQEVQEIGTLEGTIIKIGGKDETIPVTIMDLDNPKKTYNCNTSRNVAV